MFAVASTGSTMSSVFGAVLVVVAIVLVDDSASAATVI